MQNLITLKNISKKYEHSPVLKNISLDVHQGEILGLIGLNGAGKTTLIKIILDLLQSEDGTITLDGHSHTQSSARQALFYLPEKFQPSATLKAFEFLKYTLSYYGIKLDKALAREKAEKLGLNPDVLTWRISKFSKGMTQKLGLLAAMLAQRPLLILDEPMSGLDPEARILLKRLLLSAKAQGQSVFFSSHILSDIDEICDRIAIVHKGELHFTGTPADFKSKYQQDNTASSLEETFLSLIHA